MEELYFAMCSKIIMAYKRLVGVIPVKDGRVVKSYGYKFCRPAGDVVSALRNLERWNADEILLLDISRQPRIDPAIPMLIKQSGIATPLTYGGGIRCINDVNTLLAAGCERFVLETIAFNAPEKVKELADLVGAQALIASLPLTGFGASLALEQYYAKRFGLAHEVLDPSLICRRMNELPVSEVLVIAFNREGYSGSFNLLGNDLCEKGFLSDINKGIIWFGGLSGNIAGRLLNDPQTTAVAFGNSNNEKELALTAIRGEFSRTGSAHHVRRPLLR